MIVFNFAKLQIVPFGQFKGMRIEEIASGDDGLKYLDWLVGQSWLNEKHPQLKRCLEVYLKEPSIARELDTLLDA